MSGIVLEGHLLMKSNKLLIELTVAQTVSVSTLVNISTPLKAS